MKRFHEILEEIKSLEIQSAKNVAIAGVQAFLLQPDKKSAEKILATRSTEPLMQNAIKMMLNAKNKKRAAKKFNNYLKKADNKITKAGYSLIKNNMNIFTHCHSTAVMDILKNAHKKGKKFIVYNTEASPRLQGRQTAEELSGAGIKVIHLPDTAAEMALKQCDLFLFGADAYLPDGVVNKIGTGMLCELASLHNIPAYSCGQALKFTKKVKIEYRPSRELWDERNKLIETKNPAFDFTNKKFLKGVVSEFGILHYNKFIDLAKKTLKDFER